MNVSNNITQTLWNKGEYTVRCIWKWGTHFIHTRELLVYHQGKYSKLENLVDDEDFKEDYLKWLHQQVSKSHSPRNLKTYIEENVFPKLTGHIKKNTISERICQNYMLLWGYKYDEKKGLIMIDMNSQMWSCIEKNS